MSRRRGTQHLKRERQRRAHRQTFVVTTYAATADQSAENLALARELSHDQLIAMLGPRRRSGISWDWMPSPAGRQWLIDEEPKGLHREGRAAERQQLIDYLEANPDGYLVIAMAKAVAHA